VPLAVVDNQFFDLAYTDFGGVHWNSTILSHAFYLAIEGSSANASSSVSGIGAANRHQIEQVFFRAITQLMPGNVTMPLSAAVTCQAAVDLFGHDSLVAQAVDQALYAVGLRPQPEIRWCRAI
jgi:Zn-dependent metalloprotease